MSSWISNFVIIKCRELFETVFKPEYILKATLIIMVDLTRVSFTFLYLIAMGSNGELQKMDFLCI